MSRTADGTDAAVALPMTPSLGHDPGDSVVVVRVAGAIPDHLAPDHEPGQDLVELPDLIGLVGTESLLGARRCPTRYPFQASISGSRGLTKRV